MKIYVADPLKETAINGLKELGEVISDPGEWNFEVVVVRSKTNVDKEFIDQTKNLKLVIRAGVGLDNIDKEYCKTKGIEVKNTPGASTISVAELVFAHLLAISRNIVTANVSMREDKWIKKELIGTELSGKTLGIVGYGRIGRKVAKIAKSFDMEVIAYDPFIKEADVPLVSLEELIERSDVITLHLPLIPETKNLISGEKIGKMKPNTIIINAARGGIVDENALYEAMKSGKIRGAGLDVFSQEPPKNSPLRELDSVSLTPHIGASTLESGERVGIAVVDIVKEFAGR
jgi:D-3-phosphoglycerate dehydrogenase